MYCSYFISQNATLQCALKTMNLLLELSEMQYLLGLLEF